jgi:hypothetical protein
VEVFKKNFFWVVGRARRMATWRRLVFFFRGGSFGDRGRQKFSRATAPSLFFLLGPKCLFCDFLIFPFLFLGLFIFSFGYSVFSRLVGSLRFFIFHEKERETGCNDVAVLWIGGGGRPSRFLQMATREDDERHGMKTFWSANFGRSSQSATPRGIRKSRWRIPGVQTKKGEDMEDQ